MGIMKYYSHGKLLLTGEYLVLDGASALAAPARKGQSLEITVSPANTKKVEWKSFDANGDLWFEALLDRNFQILYSSDEEIAHTLQRMLIACVLLNPDFLIEDQYYEVETYLDFPRNWGLGTSSTLLVNLADWANVNAYELLNNSFSGSGYDIACARANGPILFTRSEQEIHVSPCLVKFPFEDHLWFVFLEKKQKSAKEIQRYSSLSFDRTSSVEKINKITSSLITCEHVEEFNALIETHEDILSEILQTPKVKEELFSDYSYGSVKSLGAWGGDFILVTGEKERVSTYFKEKGYNTILSWGDMLR